ncbi:MAG: hypothetical protein TREMPRED_002685 [Tremellales sp. Tagirdzhanova-0007]|nr:MAG: hypothetical protein TREMPRED_002685 [Tremellales sp. Tagirdzhanova-0007]
MQPALSVSVISGLSTSFSESVDFEIIERIIDRAPRSATSWPQVYRAYEDELEENGLSVATDTTYYQILLKLGVIRAPTYGERWEQWQAIHSIAVRSGDKPKRSRSDSRRTADIRARVPFLASASSDLDDGYMDGEADDAGGGSVMIQTRPSPRKELAKEDHSRSLVGYTPNQSVEYDVNTLHPPIRTSTPVYAQEQGYGRSTPTLPPYSVSELVEGMHTPRASQVPWLGSKQEVEDAVIREMERRADDFYQTGMMGRCWDVWYRASDWMQETAQQIDLLRTRILLQQTLVKWRSTHQHFLSLPNTADAHHALHLQDQVLQMWLRRSRQKQLLKREDSFVKSWVDINLKKTWRSWRMELVRKRTERWDRDMKARERNFVERKAGKLFLAGFQLWYDRTKLIASTRTADASFARRNLKLAFDFWREAVVRRQHVEALSVDHEKRRKRDTLLSAFMMWERRTTIDRSARILTDKRNRMLLRMAWDQWRMLRWQEHLASSFVKRHLMLRAARIWHRRLAAVQGLQRKAVVLYQRRDASLLRTVFDLWTLAERGRLLQEARQDAIVSFESSAQVFLAALSRNILRQAFLLWRHRLGKNQTCTFDTDLNRQTRSKKQSLRKWELTWRKLQMDVATAEKAKAFFLQRLAMRAWRERLVGRRQMAMVRCRQLNDLRAAFGGWRNIMAQNQQGRVMIQAFRQTQDKRLVRVSLSLWTDRIIEIKSSELDIAQRRKISILSDAMCRWKRAGQRIENAKGLMHSFMDVKMEETHKRIVRIWRDRAVSMKDRRIRLKQARALRHTRLLNEAFFTWAGRIREHKLHTIEETVALRHEDAILFEIWDKWKGRTSRLPAIVFEKTRLKRLGWQKWRKTLGWTRVVQRAAAPVERRLLDDAFMVWKKAYHRKAFLVRSTGRLRLINHGPDSRRESGGSTHTAAILPVSARRSVLHSRSTSTTRDLRAESPRESSERPRSSGSLVSEPAYSRLRSELDRKRGMSEEPPDIEQHRVGSELLRALRGTLPGR